MDLPNPLVERWRARAEQLAAWGAPEAARIWALAADELAENEIGLALELLTVAQAADESGYTPPHISRLVSEGRLTNYGENGSVRIRRGDLPKKPPPARERGEPTLVGPNRRARKAVHKGEVHIT